MSIATNKSIVAVVLAAGSSSRFGATKQLTEVAGAPLAKHVTQIAMHSKVRATTVIVGHDWQAVSSALVPFDGFLVQNERYANGIGSSLALAARTVRHAADAVLVVLADQPLITAEHLDTLIDSWTGAADEIVATAFSGISGPPALFASDCFDALASLNGDSGARSLLQDPRFTIREVAFPDAAIDIDEPGDLNRLQRSARS